MPSARAVVTGELVNLRRTWAEPEIVNGIPNLKIKKKINSTLSHSLSPSMAMVSSPKPKVHHAIALLSLIFFTSAHHSLSAADVHDLLPQFNLPKGLIPREIKSFTLSNTDNSFTLELSSNPCYVTFDDQLVYYDRIIKGKLEYGKVSGVSGIQAKKFFIWVSVTGMEVDEKNDMIEFHVGALSKKLPAAYFQDIPTCKSKGLRDILASLELDASI